MTTKIEAATWSAIRHLARAAEDQRADSSVGRRHRVFGHRVWR